MISLGCNDARKGLGLGLGYGAREMEESELEEGEACSYNDEYDDATTGPENDLSSLSYIDEKIEHVLGHFQKDFEGGVSAENLGAKFGGYGSFLPTYTRSPGWSHPKSSPKVKSCNAPGSPNKIQVEDGRHPTNFGTFPALKASFAIDSNKQDVSITSTHAHELAPRCKYADKKAAHMSDQKTLKLRIKVGSDNLLTRTNAAIYSGLGLDVSPSSSLEESSSESEGMYQETQEPLIESPTHIIRLMTSFPVPGEALLSPLPDHLLNLIVKEKTLTEDRSNFGKGDHMSLGDEKANSVGKKDFTIERKGGSKEIGNDNGIMSVDIDTLAYKELVSKPLKLTLLPNSHSAVDKVKDKSIARKKGVRDIAMEESVEPIPAQNIGLENLRASSVQKVLDDSSGCGRKDEYIKAENTCDFVKAESDTLKSSKAQKRELLDPIRKKSSHRATLLEQDNMKLPPAKEHTSSGEKIKSKGSHGQGSLAPEVPKESLRAGSSLMLKNKQTANVNNNTNKRDSGEQKLEIVLQKAEDRYREFFGDVGEAEQEGNLTSTLGIHPKDRMKEDDKIEKNTLAINGVHNERRSGKKSKDLLVRKSYPGSTVDGASNSGNMNAAGACLGTAAPVLIKENWVSCDKCMKWRLLPISIQPTDLPEKWSCSMLHWLPAMNHCSVDEEETTKAVFALYQVPAVASQNNPQNNLDSTKSRLQSADTLQPEQNQQCFGSHAMPPSGRKKHGSKEISNAIDKDGPIIKKNVQASVLSGCLTDITKSPVVSELSLHDPRRCDLPAKKHKSKQKEKHKVSEHRSGGGDAKASKMKGKRTSDQDSLRVSKKIKSESLHLAHEDCMSEHAGKGHSTSNDLPSTLLGKDQPKHSERSSYNDQKLDKENRQKVSGKKPKEKVQVSLADGSVDLLTFDGGEVSRKRKVDDSRVFVEEEFSKNDYKQEKKAKACMSKGKDSSSVSKSSSKLEKKNIHSKDHHSGQELDSTLSQRNLCGTDSLKRDFASSQPFLAATTSSSKLSYSHKSKPGFHETKDSPEKSVSSSSIRSANQDKIPSSRRNDAGKDESRDGGLFVAGSPSRCSDGEDKGQGYKSGIRKGKTSLATQNGSLDSSILDVQDRDDGQVVGSRAKASIESSPDTRRGQLLTTVDKHNDEENKSVKHGDDNVSKPRKSGKDSSQSKDRSHKLKSDFVDELDDRVPSPKVKPRDSRNDFQERLRVKSNESENRYVDDNKKSVGKLSVESSKRESQSNVGCSDAKRDVSEGQDVMSTVKKNIVQDGNASKYMKRSHSDKSDHADIASGRGNSLSLPPSSGTPNEMLTHYPRPSGPQKGNGADGSQSDDALKKVQKQIKKVDHQNGTQHGSSRHTTSGGHRIRDVDAPSPMRKDSSSQAATNALKEAKDLKHLADRVKNCGSNEESTALYFQAALKFLHSASLLESCNSEGTKQGEIIQSMQIYSSTAKLCEFCAHEYERLNDMASSSLAYKCTEVAYMRVIYISHANASRDRLELQTALQMVPPGESPSSSASDVDNVNHHTTADKVAFPKGVSSPQVAGNHVISARNRPSFVRLLNFAQDVNYAMEASRKSRIAFAHAKSSLSWDKNGEVIYSVKRALDFNFLDIEGLLRLIRVAMEAISH